MDRLAEQVVAWHNRHPLAKRITIYDVHTIGVVALPFMRSSRTAASSAPIEPVLTDEISPESLAAAWGEDDSTVAANTNAAQLDALADQEQLPGPARPSLFSRLAFWRRGSGKTAAPVKAWPAFSERFVNGLSPRQIANFAKTYGYAAKPGDDSWPQRVVPIDDAMMAKGSAAGGAWPFELYLMSAAIDAGSSRTRVLAGHGRQQMLIGRRCLSPLRIGLLVLVLLGFAATAVAVWWPHAPASKVEAPEVVAPAASAASAASSPSAAAPSVAAPDTLASAPPMPAASAASEVVAAPSPASSPADAASAPAAVPASAGLPNLRQQIALPARPPRASEPAGERATEKPAEKPPLKAPEKPGDKKPAEKSAEPAPASVPVPILGQPAGKAIEKALGGQKVVALVGPPSPGKAEAEALLDRMRKLIAPTQADPKALQGQVFQTPEGWRAGVFPFASREEAQLINATLVARGMRTRAVDF